MFVVRPPLSFSDCVPSPLPQVCVCVCVFVCVCVCVQTSSLLLWLRPVTSGVSMRSQPLRRACFCWKQEFRFAFVFMLLLPAVLCPCARTCPCVSTQVCPPWQRLRRQPIATTMTFFCFAARPLVGCRSPTATPPVGRYHAPRLRLFLSASTSSFWNSPVTKPL